MIKCQASSTVGSSREGTIRIAWQAWQLDMDHSYHLSWFETILAHPIPLSLPHGRRRSFSCLRWRLEDGQMQVMHITGHGTR
jgi:hypothetical protein